jgi:hypothetical protein
MELRHRQSAPSSVGRKVQLQYRLEVEDKGTFTLPKTEMNKIICAVSFDKQL